MAQQQDAQWIPAGTPGGGHITIFNNGYDRGCSSIDEIVPPVDSVGHYAIESGKPYGPDKPVWHYQAANRTDCFSSEISGAIRLPNGNTLICAGVMGDLFEIASGGETVGQYVNPVVCGGILAQGKTPGKDRGLSAYHIPLKSPNYAAQHIAVPGSFFARSADNRI